MRADAYTFAALNEAEAKSPRFVAAILYEVDSLYITSHAGIANVPGTVIDGALDEPTVTSQRLNPDEAAAEIGSASFGLIDLGEQFTLEVRERLQDGAGIRGRQVRFYLGYDGLPFEDFVLIGTQVVHGVIYADGKYRVNCLDIQRTLRTDIFEVFETTLGAAVAVDDTTITLTSTAGLQLVAHGPSYTDAPNQAVGYIKIRSEIIRYTGIDGNQLTGCTRGIFGTAAAAYEVDAGVPADRRESVSEYVYLEMPAIKLAYAILTGRLWGSADTLPPKWHLGVDPDLITDEDFTSIGNTLWVPDDDTAGFVVRFEGLKAQDGKRFLEKELFLLTGVYMPVYADGSLGLRRMTRLSEDAATVLTIDETNAIQVGELQHDMESLHNTFVVNWSWNGEEFRRSTGYFDVPSRAIHGASPTYTLNFKGLYGGRHTDGIIFQMLDMVRERFAGPPLRMTIQVLHGLNRIEVGDVIRVRFRHVRDFSSRQSGGGTGVDRAFEVQNVSADHRRGGVRLELFASTALPTLHAPTQPPTSLPNGYYTSAGTNLAFAPGITMVGGHITAAAQSLTGNSDATAAGSIFYYDGDLTIDPGVELQIANNVQLRVRGFLQVNGSIVGKGRGLQGVPDDGRPLAYPSPLNDEGPVPAENIPGTPGFVGSVRGYDGVRTRAALLGNYVLGTWPPHLTTSRNAVAPRLLLNVSGVSMSGLPSDLRGAGGGPGGRVGNSATLPYPVNLRGGAGANGGAGLIIVCRGMAFGANGFIDLSGDSSAMPVAVHTPVQNDVLVRYPGAGAGGGPGTLYVLLDGSSFSIPDFSGNKFRARAGDVPVPADTNALQSRRSNAWAPMQWNVTGSSPRVFSPVVGYQDPDWAANDFKDYSGSALVVQHIAGQEVPYEDVDPFAQKPPPVTGITVEAVEQGMNISLDLPPVTRFDAVHVYASIDNNRQNAAEVATGMFSSFLLRVPDGQSRRLWARTENENGYSDWFPESPTDGVLGSSIGGFTTRGGVEALGPQIRKPLSVPAGWNADAYSNETYVGGAFVSFQPAQTSAGIMVGLNSDPEADASYTSIDYAWFVSAAATLRIYEGGALVADLGAGQYTTNTVLLIKYDGQTVQYFKDGSLVRSVQRAGATFFVDSSFDTPGGAIKNLKYGPLTTAPSIPWLARGNCTATATTIKKDGGVLAWDSDCYSFEAFRNGAFLSFQVDQTNAALAIGLNADPTTNQDLTSIDFAWYVDSAGNCDMRENGGTAATAGAYTTNTVFAIAYDGRTVRFIKDGALVREVYAPDRTFYLDSSFATPGGAVRNVTFRPYGTATPVPFLARGNVVVSDTTAMKAGGSNAWEGDLVSINGYASCFLMAKPSQANKHFMLGLNSDPYTDTNYTSLDTAWQADSLGALYIYESGTHVGSYGSYTDQTVLGLTYDGTDVRYYKDRVLVRTVNMPGRVMFADASFYEPGTAINSLRFGPGTVFARIDTPELGPNAATETFSLNFSGLQGTISGPNTDWFRMFEMAFTPKYDAIVTVTNTFEFTGPQDTCRKASFVKLGPFPTPVVGEVGLPQSAGASVRTLQTTRSFFTVYANTQTRVGLAARCDNAGDIGRFWNVSITAELIKA